MNLEAIFQKCKKKLAPISDEPALEARLIIQKATGLSRPVVLSHPEYELTGNEEAYAAEMTEQRAKGFPLPYILGSWEFYGRPFFVNPSVLIPRPETEMLVEKACGWLKKHPEVRLGYDIGTGSGCIAVTLLLEYTQLHMTAIDVKHDALLTACSNAKRHQVLDRFWPVQSDLFSAFSEAPSLVCANLPYIPTQTCRTIEPARFEPLRALDGGEDGFDLYRLLFQQLSHRIKNEKILILCEIEYRQRELALQTAEAFFPQHTINVYADLAGQPRLLEIKQD